MIDVVLSPDITPLNEMGAPLEDEDEVWEKGLTEVDVVPDTPLVDVVIHINLSKTDKINQTCRAQAQFELAPHNQ